ncbi:MAG: flagellar basal-body MS-ring/collar protein FliF, partial [Planctomycetota bacterium]
MAGLANAPEQLLAIWRRVDVNHRVAIVLAGLGSLAAVVGLVAWGGRPTYSLLYSDLSRKDAAAVVAQLDSEGIPYRLADGGATVMVASDQVQQARARLMLQGVPEGGDGFEILDKGSVGMTHFAERKNYLRAVQGELGRTIGQINAIEWARVHISAPEPSVFLEEESQASASVLLKMRHGGQLSPTQVAAITAFVARSVEGLDPKHVTVTDQFLNPLSQVVQEEGPPGATAHLRAQHEIEERLETKVCDMLEATVGPGRCSVSVHAAVELKQEELRST